MDAFARHVAAVTIAILAVAFSLAVIWQVVHGHEVDALLAGLVGTTLGYLIPSPTQTQKVTVTNDPSDPVPTADVPARKRSDRGDGLVGILWAVLVVALIVLVIRAVL